MRFCDVQSPSFLVVCSWFSALAPEPPKHSQVDGVDDSCDWNRLGAQSVRVLQLSCFDKSFLVTDRRSWPSTIRLSKFGWTVQSILCILHIRNYMLSWMMVKPLLSQVLQQEPLPSTPKRYVFCLRLSSLLCIRGLSIVWCLVGSALFQRSQFHSFA